MPITPEDFISLLFAPAHPQGMCLPTHPEHDSKALSESLEKPKPLWSRPDARNIALGKTKPS